jgi:HEAT repeat protein
MRRKSGCSDHRSDRVPGDTIGAAMAKARSSEAKLAKLRALRGAPSSPEVLKELRTALGDASNLVVAEAAAMASEGHYAELVPEMLAAFDRFLDEPEETDKRCRAKIAIAEALNQLEFSEEDFLWRGARFVQFEPVWGGEQDTAAPLRVACAFSLVRIHAHGVMPYLVDLICDPEKIARVGAAQALAYSETDAAGLLLRLKARLGDEEPEVVSECFNGLLKVTPQEGLAFVAEFLNSPDQAVQEAAILALGDSRRREAFEILKDFWEKRVPARLQETVLMALALLRLPMANDFLLALVTGESEAIARMALAALAVHRYDARLRERIAAAVSTSGRAALRGYFEERFRVKD